MKEHIVKYAVLLLVCCALLGCGKEEGSSTVSGKGSIFGTVTDLATGNPVSNANVQLRPSGETTLTGYDGHYEFLDVPSGTYSIKVTKEGYSDLIDDYDIVVTNGKQTKRDVQIKKLPSSLHIYDNESNEISELDFGADEGVTQKTFNIFNGGSQSLQYVINPIQANWVMINPNQQSGTVGVGVTYPIIVTINRELLADGNNTAVLTITSATDGGKELTIKARKSSAGDGVYELPSAGLMVQTEDLGHVDWSSAKLLCENSTVAGYNDWRLPTKEELMTLYSNRELIGGFVDECYWSSSLYGSNHYFVNFSNGVSSWSPNNNNHYYVRAVRTWDNSAPITLLDNSNNVITELNFGSEANTTQKTFKIKNTGTQNVHFNVTNTANWIVSTNPSSGELNAGSTTSILVAINREMLAVGDNTSSLLVNTPSNGGKELVVRAVRTPSYSNPVVTTTAPTNITSNSATCGGNVISDGGGNITERGICLSRSPNPDINNSTVLTSGSETGTFTVNVINMASNATYYVKAYAKNVGGKVGYGEEIHFTTDAFPTFQFGGETYQVAPDPGNKMTWSNANSYCNNLTINGISGWRLPNADELMRMYVVSSSIGGFSTGHYWSSTTCEDGHSTVGMGYGSTGCYSDDYTHRVRPIRPENGGGGGGGVQTYSFDFEDGWQGWQVIDADGDGNTWRRFYSTEGNIGHNGSVYTMGSESYINNVGALYPDNYLVSPQRYTIPNGGKISFYVCAQDADFPAEHYGVAVSTGSSPDSDNFVTIWEETLSAKVKSGDKVRGNRAQGNWYLKTVNLSAYAGQTIWIAIRHFGCTDQFVINVDDITIVTGN